MREPDGSLGFGLLELLVVLVLLGAAAAVTYYGLGGPHRYSLVSVARQVHAEVATARARAIAEAVDYRIELRGGSRLYVSRRRGAGWELVGRPTELARHATVSIDGSSSGSIGFLRHGRPDRPHTVVVRDSREHRTLRVMASGLIRWENR